MRGSMAPALLLLLALTVSGCSYLDKLTGDTDNTVLPGAREDAIPGKTQFPDAADTVPIEQPGGGQTAAQQAQTGAAQNAPAAPSACTDNDPDCKPPADDVFSDPQ